MNISAIAKRNKGLSFLSTLLLGAVALVGLQACGGGSSSSAVKPVISVASATKSEGNSGTTTFDFIVTLSEATTVDVSVDYSTSNGTATAGEDFTATSGTLTIPKNTSSAKISVPVMGDVAIENDETFSLTINNASKATINGGTQTVTGTIDTDDLAGYYTGDGSVNEAAGSLDLTGKLQVISADDRLVIINLADDLIYIAPYDGFSGDTFNTTARIYKAGDFTNTTTVSGTFVYGASINLTLSGTGDYTTGSVNLAYSAKNTVAPVVYNASDEWLLPLETGILFNTSTNIDFALGSTSVSSTELKSCRSTNIDTSNVITEQIGRIRSFDATVISCTDSATDNTIVNSYFTTFDDSAIDDAMLFVVFNSNSAYSISLSQP